ncbi:MAG: MBL fold metallo-hydrolase RNA specificity domain-containing protein [Candidatus Norongarragalinales archaeon]
MEVSFLGAAREVGRSAILLEGKKRVLLDCGIKLNEEELLPILEQRVIRKLDCVALSHAHLDHSGFLPGLFAEGYRKKVVLTKPTRDLTQLLLADYLRINEGEAAFGERDVASFLASTQMLEYGERTSVFTLYDAGHILGSALVEVNDSKRVLYTGDLNTRPTRLLDGAKTGLAAEALIIESTYGAPSDSLPSLKEAGAYLANSIRDTLRRGGKVLIPTFAIGRGQEILFTIENYMRSGGIPKAPIYLDGMIKKALRIYRHNAIYLKREVQRRILTSEDDPFNSELYAYPEKKDRSDVINGGPAVILATSGMLNGGPILTYIKALGGDPKNKIVLVGFQAKGTRGRELLEGADELVIDDERVPINMQVDEARFSGHCDHRDLLEFAKNIRGLRKVFVVHGEEEKTEAFADALREWAHKAKRRIDVVVPRLGETHKV